MWACLHKYSTGRHKSRRCNQRETPEKENQRTRSFFIRAMLEIAGTTRIVAVSQFPIERNNAVTEWWNLE